MSHDGACSSQPAGDRSEVLILDGDFDSSNAVHFKQALDHALHAGRPQLIVDLRGVSFLDSTMLAVLIRGLGDLVAAGGHLALIRPNTTVWKMFVLAGRGDTFPAFARLDEALASFALND